MIKWWAKGLNVHECSWIVRNPHDFWGISQGSGHGLVFLIGMNRFKVKTYQHLRQFGWNLTSGWTLKAYPSVINPPHCRHLYLFIPPKSVKPTWSSSTILFFSLEVNVSLIRYKRNWFLVIAKKREIILAEGMRRKSKEECALIGSWALLRHHWGTIHRTRLNYTPPNNQKSLFYQILHVCLIY